MDKKKYVVSTGKSYLPELITATTLPSSGTLLSVNGVENITTWVDNITGTGWWTTTTDGTADSTVGDLVYPPYKTASDFIPTYIDFPVIEWKPVTEDDEGRPLRIWDIEPKLSEDEPLKVIPRTNIRNRKLILD